MLWKSPIDLAPIGGDGPLLRKKGHGRKWLYHVEVRQAHGKKRLVEDDAAGSEYEYHISMELEALYWYDGIISSGCPYII